MDEQIRQKILAILDQHRIMTAARQQIEEGVLAVCRQWLDDLTADAKLEPVPIDVPAAYPPGFMRLQFLSASGPCPMGNDCQCGKADAKGLQRQKAPKRGSSLICIGPAKSEDCNFLKTRSALVRTEAGGSFKVGPIKSPYWSRLVL